MRRTAVYKHPLFLAHYTGRDHPESADRLREVYRELERPEVAAQLVFPSFTPATVATITLNHNPGLIEQVAATSRHLAAFLDADTRTSSDSYAAALMASGAVIDGVGRIHQGEIDNGFCLVRPPGHHGEDNHAMGFCLFNHVAVAAQWALHNLGLDRIMIIDWDLHHGNGTQKSFYSTNKVLYCSTHQFPLYPGSGTLTESGEGPGLGYTVNIPLSGGYGDAVFNRIYSEIVQPIAQSYRPEMIIVSCGFDLMAGDPLGALRVTPAGIATMTRILVALAEELCQGKLLITLEGGYNLENVRHGTMAVLSELLGVPLAVDRQVWLSSPPCLQKDPHGAAAAGLEPTLQWLRQWWPV